MATFFQIFLCLEEKTQIWMFGRDLTVIWNNQIFGSLVIWTDRQITAGTNWNFSTVAITSKNMGENENSVHWIQRKYTNSWIRKSLRLLHFAKSDLFSVHFVFLCIRAHGTKTPTCWAPSYLFWFKSYCWLSCYSLHITTHHLVFLVGQEGQLQSLPVMK